MGIELLSTKPVWAEIYGVNGCLIGQLQTVNNALQKLLRRHDPSLGSLGVICI